MPLKIESPTNLLADDSKMCKTIIDDDNSNILQDDIFEAFNCASKLQLTFNTNTCKCKNMNIRHKQSDNTYYKTTTIKSIL